MNPPNPPKTQKTDKKLQPSAGKAANSYNCYGSNSAIFYQGGVEKKIICYVEDEKRFFSNFDFLQEIYPFSPLSS